MILEVARYPDMEDNPEKGQMAPIKPNLVCYYVLSKVFIDIPAIDPA
jgi:hypothetical protein